MHAEEIKAVELKEQNHLKIPGTSCISNIHRIMDNVQHVVYIMNKLSRQTDNQKSTTVLWKSKLHNFENFVSGIKDTSAKFTTTQSYKQRVPRKVNFMSGIQYEILLFSETYVIVVVG
jgi:hypothetical protein